jgi:hypothetical protein
MNKVLWKDKEYTVEILTHMRTENLAIVLSDAETLEDLFPDYIMASVPLDNLEYGEIGINSFGEKLGMINALMDAEVIEHPHRYLVVVVKDTKQTVPIVRLKHSFINLLGIKVSQSKQNSGEYANSARPAAK